MNKINELKVEGLLDDYNNEYEQTGEKIEGTKNLILIGIETHKTEEYIINYSDIEEANFLKAIIDGKGDLWEDEWSTGKGQRILGDYIIHEDYIEPNNTAKFKLNEYFHRLTVIIEKPSRQIITHYDSTYTEKFENVDFIEIDDSSILITNQNIYKLYIIPEIIPENFAEQIQNKELIAPPYFKLNEDLYMGETSSPDTEALGRGESFSFEARRVNQ